MRWLYANRIGMIYTDAYMITSTSKRIMTKRGLTTLLGVLLISISALLIFGYNYTYANTGEENNSEIKSNAAMEKLEKGKGRDLHKRGKWMHPNPEKIKAGIEAKLESGEITQEQADSFMFRERLYPHTTKTEPQVQI